MRSWFDSLRAPGLRAPSPYGVRIVAVALVAALGASGAASSFAIGPEDGGVVLAEFEDAGALLVGADVKVHGATVGQVGEPVVAEDNKAIVPMHMDGEAMPVFEDATAEVGPLVLLGERVINLDRGSPSAGEMAPGQAIPAERTDTQVELQEVLNELDDPTAEALGSLVIALGQGIGGDGDDVQETLQALEPAMTDTDALVRVLAEQNELLGSVVDRVEPVTSALSEDDGAQLDQMVDQTTTLLDATASRDAQLESTLAELPSTLQQAQTTLAELTGTATAAEDTLAEMRPTTDNLTEISAELQEFADSADPALASAEPVLDRGNELLTEARPLAQELRQAGPDLASTVEDAQPIVEDLEGNFGHVLGFIRHWALTTNGRDGLAHYFRAHFIVNEDSAGGFLPGGTETQAEEPEDRQEPRERIDEPTFNDENALSNPPLPDGLLSSSNSDDSGETGLNEEQEEDALGFLLGGN